MWNLARTFAVLLHWWWRSDRIRAPPSEGRLLRLTPPCFLRIAGESVKVVSRHVRSDADQQVIVHRCESAGGDFELVVWLATDGPQVCVRRDGRERPVAAADVEVIAGAACSARLSIRSPS
jgi:hypothetical protein